LGIPLSNFMYNISANEGNGNNFYGSRIGNYMDGFNHENGGRNFYNQNKQMEQNYGNHARGFSNIYNR